MPDPNKKHTHDESCGYRIEDCTILYEYSKKRLQAVVTAPDVACTNRIEDEQQIIDFFETLTDTQMALVAKYAHLLRNAR